MNGDTDDGAALLRALSDEPAAVLYDLTGLTARSGLPRALDMLLRYLTAWSGTAVLVCADQASLRKLLGDHPIGAWVTIWPSLQSAMQAAHAQPGPVRAFLDLDPRATAPRTARRFAHQTLRPWCDQLLLEHANLVVSELTTNVVLHADTPMTLSLTRTAHPNAPSPTTVRIAVRDGNDTIPAPGDPAEHWEGGRGLWLVSTIARYWGVIPLAAGKTVWAVLDGEITPPTPAN